MIRGISTALIVGAIGIVIHIVLMFVRPAKNRLRSMAICYILSLPFVYLVCCWLSPQASTAFSAAPLLGLIHAYVLHLLIFFLYAEFFYAFDRAVTLQLLVEILKQDDPTSEQLKETCSFEELIQERLKVLESNNFIVQREGRWRLKVKGAFFARTMKISSFLFRTQSQRERN